MKSIGIILNPSAKINRKKTANIIEELKDIFGGSAETPNVRGPNA